MIEMVCIGGCGELTWTERTYGKIMHKHVCERRKDLYCQSHPEGCPDVNFTYELLGSLGEVRDQIKLCEGHHVQQVAFSSFMDALTQVCFTEQKIRSVVLWERNRSWRPRE